MQLEERVSESNYETMRGHGVSHRKQFLVPGDEVEHLGEEPETWSCPWEDPCETGKWTDLGRC